jgi:hypothetical protein
LKALKWSEKAEPEIRAEIGKTRKIFLRRSQKFSRPKSPNPALRPDSKEE